MQKVTYQDPGEIAWFTSYAEGPGRAEGLVDLVDPGRAEGPRSGVVDLEDPAAFGRAAKGRARRGQEPQTAK